MSTLLCFGFGYSARHYVAGCGGRHHRVIATVRGAAVWALSRLVPERLGALFSAQAAEPDPMVREEWQNALATVHREAP